MYYTINPLPDINNDFSGLILMGIFLAVYAWLLLIPSYKRDWRTEHNAATGLLVSVVFLLILGISVYRSVFVEYPLPLNEPVTATLAGEYSYSANDGLKGRTQSHSRVVYIVSEGEIAFERASGLVYPRTAILYRQHPKH